MNKLLWTFNVSVINSCFCYGLFFWFPAIIITLLWFFTNILLPYSFKSKVFIWYSVIVNVIGLSVFQTRRLSIGLLRTWSLRQLRFSLRSVNFKIIKNIKILITCIFLDNIFYTITSTAFLPFDLLFIWHSNLLINLGFPFNVFKFLSPILTTIIQPLSISLILPFDLL